MRVLRIRALLLGLLVLGLIVLYGLGARPARSPVPTPTVDSGTSPSVPPPELVPFMRDGLHGLMPDGWTETEPGTYVSADRDATFVVQQLPSVPLALILPVVMGNIGVDAEPETLGQREVNGINWALYRTTTDGKPIDFALGQGSGANYLILLQSPIGQQADWHNAVFLPLIDALQAAD